MQPGGVLTNPSNNYLQLNQTFQNKNVHYWTILQYFAPCNLKILKY